MNKLAEAWQRRGRYHTVDGFDLFVVDLPPTEIALGPPVVFLASAEAAGLTGQRIVAVEFPRWLEEHRAGGAADPNRGVG